MTATHLGNFMTELELSEITKRGHVKVKGGPIDTGLPAVPVKSKRIINQGSKPPNKTEIRFETDFLKPMKWTGEIVTYRHESIRLRLANGKWYKADWQATNAADKICFFEVKGGRPRQREAGIGDIKVAAFQYPEFEFWICKWDGEWTKQRVLA